MSDQDSVTLLAITSYFKGEDLLREAKKQGCHVMLLTQDNLKEADWPHDSIDEFLLSPDLSNIEWLVNTVSYLCRTRKIDCVIPLDEYDVENVATLREHLRMRGMGQTATRVFRDKLAMRMKAREAGIKVPSFVQVLNYDDLRHYMQEVPPPWMLKPRTEAGAMGIKKVNSQDELWGWLENLGDRQSFFLLEKYLPGEVYHVDSIIWDGKVIFESAQQYGQPPMDVAHGGGVFISHSLPSNSADVTALKKMNKEVISALGMERGVTHAEYIKAAADGQFYFLEVAGRVGGAHLADLVEASSGINLWREWANVNIADARGVTYQLPKVTSRHAALLVCLARQEYPDLSAYAADEVVWKLHKKQHAGLIIASEDYKQVQSLLEQYSRRFVEDFLAVAPPKDKPTD